MAWIYFQESAESVSRSNHGCEQFVIVNETDSHKASFCRECNQVILIPHQFGMTCERLKKKFCHQLTLFSEASHVRTSVLLELEKVWKASEADYSLKLSDLQKKFDRALSSLKMLPPFENADWMKLSDHLPKLGMTVAGRLFLPQALERLTSVKGGSYWHTPRALEIEESYENYIARMKRSKDPKCNTKKGPLNLSMQVKTPHLWPPPAAREYRDNGRSPSEMNRNSTTLATIAGGQLSPMWVEWLMGYPIGWTELNALGIQWFHSKSIQRSKS